MSTPPSFRSPDKTSGGRPDDKKPAQQQSQGDKTAPQGPPNKTSQQQGDAMPKPDAAVPPADVKH